MIIKTICVKSEEKLAALKQSVYIMEIGERHSIILGLLNPDYVSLSAGIKMENGDTFAPFFCLNLNTFLIPFKSETESGDHMSVVLNMAYGLLDSLMNFAIVMTNQENNYNDNTDPEIVAIKEFLEMTKEDPNILNGFMGMIVDNFDKFFETVDVTPTKTKLSLVSDNTPKILH